MLIRVGILADLLALLQERPRPPSAPVLSDDSKFIVPYIQNVNFTGRVDLLNEIRAKLCEVQENRWNHSLALAGLGGVGKTQLAIAYTYKFRSDYEYTYWISAADEPSLIADLGAIAEATKCVTVLEDSDRSQITKSVMRWLAKLPKALVVLDNLDTVEILHPYRPDLSTSETHFLITLRNQNYDQIPSEGLEVGVMGISTYLGILRENPKYHRARPSKPNGLYYRETVATT